MSLKEILPEAHHWVRSPHWPHDEITCMRCKFVFKHVPKDVLTEQFFQDLANSSNPPPECAVFLVHNS